MPDKRTILIVLDGVGVGALPDAAAYGDEGTDTLGHVLDRTGIALPNLFELGLGLCLGLSWNRPVLGSAGRMAERSAGKDTTTGHFELAGLVLEKPFPTFPNGFPEAFLAAYEREIGMKTLGNVAASGTEILDRLGEQHLRTGWPIVYTSADSVFQIAAHESIIPPQVLYGLCEIARSMLTGDLGVGRVIARPFVGKPGQFTRTAGRRDFSLAPPEETLLDRLCQAGRTVLGIGKIEDIFAGRGLTDSIHASGNAACMQALRESLATVQDGLIFVNLVDFDMLYGHRRDPDGFARALSEFDEQLPGLMARMGDEDLLILTADHGCDPTHSGTDHTREYVPVLLFGKNLPGGRALGTRTSFTDAAATVLTHQGLLPMAWGHSML